MSNTNTIVVEGRNIELTPAIKDYVHEKISRIQNHFDSIIKTHEIKVTLNVLKNPSIANNQKAEVTINLKGGHVIRSQASESTIYASIDVVTDKVDTQLRRYKTRIYNHLHNGKGARTKDFGIDLETLGDFTIPSEVQDRFSSYEKPKIIKTKRFKMEAIEPEIAVEKLNDSGHDFYMFLNVFTNRIAVVYPRQDGDYGLIEPEFLEVAN